MLPFNPFRCAQPIGRATALSLVLCAAAPVHAGQVVAVDFTATPAPASDDDMLRTYSRSQAVVRYADGIEKAVPLTYNVLFKNTDRIGKYEAGRLYDVDGSPLVDLRGDPVIAETPDANSLLNVDGRLFLITHMEYDWILGDGSVGKAVEGWYSRMPMSMVLTNVEQGTDGTLKAVAQRPIDFSGVNGLWIPCFGSQTPWNTHLGSEEDYDLYFTRASGDKAYKTATKGLKALTEVYFNNRREANPYHYGYITEIAVGVDGSTDVTKHYAMGRGTWEMAQIMPDQRTAYYGDDGSFVAMFMFVADKAGDLSSGTLYAARWNQVSADDGGAATLSWVRLGHASSSDIRQAIDSGITFDDIFDSSVEPADGFTTIRAGHSGTEHLRLKPGMDQVAAFIEARRLAALKGATTEFNKMEGVALDPKAKDLYMAMSYIEKGMQQDDAGPTDHIRVGKLKAGGTYRISLAAGQADTDGNTIGSDWVGIAMHVPPALLGEDIPPDALGNTANPDRVANPDNVFFSDKMRTLFVGEDSGTHVNNFVWAYNVDTNKLTRILSLASGSEATGLQVVDNENGHAYIMSNNQHQGEWLKSMPQDVKERLTARARETYGTNAKGALNYQLDANIGYIGGIPGL